MGRTAELYSATDYYALGTPAEAFLENFKSGRTTQVTCPSNSGLMPNPELGCDGLSNIFIDHIYSASGTRAWEMTAAISGAHTLGSASIANSGYNGFWGAADQAGKFNNDYYRSILVKGWYQEKAVNGNAAKNQFKRIDREIGNAHKEMMLSTDMCLAFDANINAAGCRGNACNTFNGQGTPLLAQSHDCCAWVETNVLFDNNIYSATDSFDCFSDADIFGCFFDWLADLFNCWGL